MKNLFKLSHPLRSFASRDERLKEGESILKKEEKSNGKIKNEIVFGFFMLLVITVLNISIFFYFHLNFAKDIGAFLFCEFYCIFPFVIMLYELLQENKKDHSKK